MGDDLPREFDKTFNVQVPARQWGSFKGFINLLRNRLMTDRFTHNRPVLRREQNPPAGWFHVVLQSDANQITLRIRADNLYLVGYHNGQWWEFRNREQLIPGSNILPYDGNYNSLVNGNLGQQPLINAVNQLANPATTDPARKCALFVVIQMICESIRFDRISDYIATLSGDRSEAPPSWMRAYVNGWGNLSEALLRADANPEDRTGHHFPLPRDNATGIRSAVEAARDMGICKIPSGFCFGSSGKRSRRMAIYGLWQHGRPKVEVFSLCINDIDGESTGELYGTIRVEDGLGCQELYNRKDDDYESISPNNNALLTGPAARSISALDSFTISFDLKDKDVLWDDEVVKEEFSWNVYHTTNEYDKLKSEEIKGAHGKVTLNYAVLSDAVQATIGVYVMYADNEKILEFYGDITARNSNINRKSLLFHKTSKPYIEQWIGEPVPLSRSIVAVPLNSSLIVEALLYDKDIIFSDVIADGTAEFTAQTSGTIEKNIYGHKKSPDDRRVNRIIVSVTWDI